MAIEVSNVRKTFGDFVALNDASIRVPDGALTALLGPSGGGKSTLLRIVAGLEIADEGRVLIDDVDVTNAPARERGIGFVFQHYAPFKHLTVWNNVAFGLKIRRTSKHAIQDRVAELLELVHLDGLAHRYPAQLSGGQRQRMALARALAIRPRVLLLDEPFGALDAKVRAELREWLRRLHDDMHVTTVFVTHDQEEALEIADEIVVINAGTIEQAGTPDQLYDEPVSPFVMGFIGPMTQLGDRYVRPHDIALSRTSGADTRAATVERVLRLGSQTRVDVHLADDTRVTVEMSRAYADDLDLRSGETVYLALHRVRRFDVGGTDQLSEGDPLISI